MFLGSHRDEFYDHQIHVAYQVVGANWYMLSVESELRCWRRELRNASLYHRKYMSCVDRNPNVFTLLNRTCSLVDPDTIKDPNTFNYGIFFDALDSRVVESTTDFPQKFFYCFWWGLRNLRLANIIFCILVFIYANATYLFNFISNI